MKTAVFWDVVACSVVKFTEVSEVLTASIIRAILILIALMMEAGSTS
jgi:hypothetical protein